MKFSILMLLTISAPLITQAQSIREVKHKELSVESTREFSGTKGHTSIARKMNLFEMPEEFQCPLFSDSPYMDVLSAVDKMQIQLNTVFPGCENKANNDQLSAQAGQIRKQIFEAQKLQSQGQSYKLNLTTNSIIQMTQQLQQSLFAISKSQTRVCYKDNQQFRNVIFSMNETFQSLAPIVLDFVKNNPALAATMGPTLKILAGFDNISKGLVMIEQVAKDSVMFDMTIPENRINTIKNTCQFMKLYRRVQYLRLSQLGQVQSVHADFQNKIGMMNSKLEKIKNDSVIKFKDAAFDSSGMNISVSTDPVFDLFEAVSKNINTETNRVQKALADIDSAKEQYNLPLIPQCQTVLSIRKNTLFNQTISDISKFSVHFGSSNVIESMIENLKSYDEEFRLVDKNKDKKTCVQMGQDWLKTANQILFEGQKLVSKYEISMSELNGEKFVSEQKKISQKEKQIQNEKSNYESLKTLINVAAFESAELEKNFRNMHRYLFKGPDMNEIQASCDQNTKSKDNCSTAKIKAMYQWYRNDGPVYELLTNDKLYFDEELGKVVGAIQSVLSFEQRVTQKEYNGKIPSAQKEFDKYIARTYELAHVSTKYLVKNSAEHANICRQSNLALNSYLKATGYLANSESLCNMIYPALDAETNISKALLSYCQPVNGKMSGIQHLIIRLVGSQAAKNTSVDVYQNNFKYSIKTMVDQLIQKYDDLGCEQKSGIN